MAPVLSSWPLRCHARFRILPLALLSPLQLIDLRRLLPVHLVFTCIIAAYGNFPFYFGLDLFRPEGGKYAFHQTITDSGTSYFRAKGNFVGPGSFANHMMMFVLLFCSPFFLPVRNAGLPGGWDRSWRSAPLPRPWDQVPGWAGWWGCPC